MPKYYSFDLRDKVISYLNRGGSKASASKLFSVNRQTIYNWLSLYSTTGSYSPTPKSRGYHKLDPSILQQKLSTKPDATLKELAAELDVSYVSIWKSLKKLGITRKKTTLYLERNPKKRKEYLLEIKDIPKEDLVYVDESGIDSRIYRDYARIKRGVKVYR